MPRHEQWDFDLNGLRIVICQGNIVAWRLQDKQDIAVVNAANEELLGAVGDDEDYSNSSMNFILYQVTEVSGCCSAVLEFDFLLGFVRIGFGSVALRLEAMTWEVVV